MDRVRIGIIGCGVIGKHHIEAAATTDIIELQAIADLTAELRNEAAKAWSPISVYDDGRKLLKDPEVDGVVLAFPTAKRTEMALDAFRAGKHVLTEKPVAMNQREVESMIDAQGDLVGACCSSRFQFIPSAREARKLVAEGRIGEPQLIRCRAMVPAKEKPPKPRPEWRLKKHLNGGGILVNWGCYDLDYLFSITGWTLDPRVVLAQTWTVPPDYVSHIAPDSDAETHYTAIVGCADGRVLQIERGEYTQTSEDAVWEIIGTKGALRLCMTDTSSKEMVLSTTDPREGTTRRTLWEGESGEIEFGAGPIRDFADAIRNRRRPATDLTRALVIQKITDALYESADTGRAVDIVPSGNGGEYA